MYIIYHIYHVIQRDISTYKLRIYNKLIIATTQDSNTCITIQTCVCVCNTFLTKILFNLFK